MNDIILSKSAKLDEYVPTTGELKLLEVLMLPENATRSITDKCEMAGLSRASYYKMMKKPEFQQCLKVTALDLVKQQIVELMNVGINQAKDGSFQHWKILLEMIGLHSDKVDANLNVSFEQLLKKALSSGDDPQD